MNYSDYLQTPEWRQRRNQRLRDANWRCRRCDGKVNLQVHHRTYERLGDERDEDLEVLCRQCHEGAHFAQGRDPIGLYIRVAAETLKDNPDSVADFSEAVKVRCAKLGIPYRGDQIVRALRIVMGKDKMPVQRIPDGPLGFAQEEPGTPFSREEAALLVRNLGLKVPVKSIPGGRLLMNRDDELIIGKGQREMAEQQKAAILEKPATTLTPEWEHAQEECACGWCNATITASTLRLVMRTLKWTKLRCVPCAEKLGFQVPA